MSYNVLPSTPAGHGTRPAPSLRTALLWAVGGFLATWATWFLWNALAFGLHLSSGQAGLLSLTFGALVIWRCACHSPVYVTACLSGCVFAVFSGVAWFLYEFNNSWTF